jgi:hypothetical protein
LSYLIVIPRTQPSLFNRWAALALEISAIIFWLVGFATMAGWASKWADAAHAAHAAAGPYGSSEALVNFFTSTNDYGTDINGDNLGICHSSPELILS